jgi:hypothetical protein
MDRRGCSDVEPSAFKIEDLSPLMGCCRLTAHSCWAFLEIALSWRKPPAPMPHALNRGGLPQTWTNRALWQPGLPQQCRASRQSMHPEQLHLSRLHNSLTALPASPASLSSHTGVNPGSTPPKNFLLANFCLSLTCRRPVYNYPKEINSRWPCILSFLSIN